MDYQYYSDNHRQRYGLAPFYMSYATDFLRGDVSEVERDAEYLTSMYPKDALRIRKHIEKALRLLEYPGSILYDEYPDRIMLKKLGENIRKGIRDVEDIDKKADLFDVLLCQEMLKKRHRRERKYYNF